MSTDTAPNETNVASDLASEIDSAVDSTMDALETQRAQEAESETPANEPGDSGGEASTDDDASDDSTSQDGKSLESTTEETQAPSVPDELLQRAVKAGMDLSDARALAGQDADAFERTLGIMEKSTSADDSQGDDDSGKTEDDPLAGIPDLDPDVYDDKIVGGFKAMKDIIRGQQETIKALKSNGESGSWLDQQTEALGVNATAEQKAELSEQFDVLKSGYEAKGKEVSDEAVFQQAASLVLGDDIQAAVDADKAAKAKKRQKISRPSGQGTKSKADPLEEVASEIDRKYFSK
jgi:hypothetical protein